MHYAASMKALEKEKGNQPIRNRRDPEFEAQGGRVIKEWTLESALCSQPNRLSLDSALSDDAVMAGNNQPFVFQNGSAPPNPTINRRRLRPFGHP